MAVNVFSVCLLSVALLAGLGQAQWRPQKPQRPQTLLPPGFQRPGGSTQQQGAPKNPDQEQNTCDLAPQSRIQCGLPGITQTDCEAINCCFDGQSCYYGKAVTLQCTKDGQYVVVIAKDVTLPSIDVESLQFLGANENDNCQPVATSPAFIIYQFPVTACGSTFTETEGNVLTYETRLSSSYEVAVGPNGAITRDSQFDLLLQCRYSGSSVQAFVVEVFGLPTVAPVAAAGALSVELRLGNGQCSGKGCVEEDAAYSSYYLASEYPVRKVLRDSVYVEVRLLDRTDPSLVLTLDRCWATSNPDPSSLPQWDLLVNGCPYRDDKYQTTLVPVNFNSGLQFPSHYRRFAFKMFTFVNTGGASPKGNPKDAALNPLQEMVYIHCNTEVCQAGAKTNCEPRCFRKRRDVSALVKSEQESVTVSSSQIIFVDSSSDAQ